MICWFRDECIKLIAEGINKVNLLTQKYYLFSIFFSKHFWILRGSTKSAKCSIIKSFTRYKIAFFYLAFNVGAKLFGH